MTRLRFRRWLGAIKDTVYEFSRSRFAGTKRKLKRLCRIHSSTSTGSYISSTESQNSAIALYRILTNNCLMKRRHRRSDIALESLDDPSTAKDGRFADRIPRWEESTRQRNERSIIYVR